MCITCVDLAQASPPTSPATVTATSHTPFDVPTFVINQKLNNNFVLSFIIWGAAARQQPPATMSVEETDNPSYIVTAPGEEGVDDKSDVKVSVSTKNVSHSTRSHSLQSSSMSAAFVDQASNLTASLAQQLKAQSSMNIVSEKHVQKFTSSSSSTSTSTTKGKFTSFLQHPDSTATSHGATFLTAQQKHVRQFVRSTSAHSSTDGGTGISLKSEKCIRSASQQMDDVDQLAMDQSKTFQQSSSILISKSAETIEALKSTSSSAHMRTQLTLSGGFLAPPNRKLTILSPIHNPPGLHELLKKHRSPLSPRISFPGSECELFP